MSRKNWKQGRYILKNPEKYLGDVNNIIYRSSWEEEAFRHLDLNPNILKWCSEEIPIQYMKPDPKTDEYTCSVYYQDLFIVKEDVNGNIGREIIEIKPYKQTKSPRSRKPSTRLYEEYQWIVNQHKWEAASSWCKAKGIEFRIMTEKDMFS